MTAWRGTDQGLECVRHDVKLEVVLYINQHDVLHKRRVDLTLDCFGELCGVRKGEWGRGGGDEEAHENVGTCFTMLARQHTDSHEVRRTECVSVSVRMRRGGSGGGGETRGTITHNNAWGQAPLPFPGCLHSTRPC